jgi:mannobiose 2-epimerase
MRRCAFLAIALLPALAAQDPARYVPVLEKTLYQNILGFWHPRAIDTAHGGYALDFDAQGQPRPNPNKMIVTQARMVWFYSRLARSGYRKDEMLKAAAHGVDFLRSRMWDVKHGGFYWQVDAAGKVINSQKHLYGQAFALYALSEYYLASGKGEALSLATRLFDVMERKAHDARYGGYRESFREDWFPDPEPGPLGDSSLKLMNTHLHLMEAMTWYAKASQQPLALARLRELIDIETNAVVRKRLGACTDKYAPDWTPRLEGDYARVSYGHDLENVWLIQDAAQVAGIPVQPFADLFRELWAYSLKYGYDAQQGGFFDWGWPDKPATGRDKTWWVQAEALVSALRMWKLTGDRQYAEVFVKTWNFVEKQQIDWQTGEWWQSVAPDGQKRGPKGSVWKAAYHNGRAMMECLELLRAK